jgi:hypothetical protein
MEQLDAAGVVAWVADALKLPQYAAVVKEHAVEGDILLELAKRDKLTALKITNSIHQAQTQVALAKLRVLRRKRSAESPIGKTTMELGANQHQSPGHSVHDTM